MTVASASCVLIVLEGRRNAAADDLPFHTLSCRSSPSGSSSSCSPWLNRSAGPRSAPLIRFPLVLIFAIACAPIWRAAVRGRLTGIEASAVYLDSAIVFAAVAASALLALGGSVLDGPQAVYGLLFAALFFGMIGGAAVLNLALAPVRSLGGWTSAVVGSPHPRPGPGLVARRRHVGRLERRDCGRHLWPDRDRLRRRDLDPGSQTRATVPAPRPAGPRGAAAAGRRPVAIAVGARGAPAGPDPARGERGRGGIGRSRAHPLRAAPDDPPPRARPDRGPRHLGREPGAGAPRGAGVERAALPDPRHELHRRGHDRWPRWTDRLPEPVRGAGARPLPELAPRTPGRRPRPPARCGVLPHRPHRARRASRRGAQPRAADPTLRRLVADPGGHRQEPARRPGGGRHRDQLPRRHRAPRPRGAAQARGPARSADHPRQPGAVRGPGRPRPLAAGQAAIPPASCSWTSTTSRRSTTRLGHARRRRAAPGRGAAPEAATCAWRTPSRGWAATSSRSSSRTRTSTMVEQVGSRLLGALRAPFEIAGKQVHIGASVGRGHEQRRQPRGGGPAPQRRRGDVHRQEPGQGPPRDLRSQHAYRRRHPARAQGRPRARPRPRRAPGPLPADLPPLRRRPRRIRDPRPLAPPRPGRGRAQRVHSTRRGDGPDRAHRSLGARPGLPPGPGVARGRWRRGQGQREPCRPPAPRPGHRGHGGRASWPRPASSPTP